LLRLDDVKARFLATREGAELHAPGELRLIAVSQPRGCFPDIVVAVGFLRIGSLGRTDDSEDEKRDTYEADCAH
jgi:hypothetical protein